MTNTAVEFRNVKKRFADVEVFEDVNLAIEEGEFVAFVGPSGSGKSTLLRMIAGLESVTDGYVFIGGEDVTFAEPSERGIAMVFQSYALYPHMNVYNNIAFNLRLAKVSKAEIERRVGEAARILRLEELLLRSPAQLSGGQRQRVAIGRAIVRNPKVFLFDEPLSNLDAALRVQMRFEIERLHKELRATMIYVTHDQVEAMTLADRIVVLDNCKIQQIGSPLDLYEHPRNRFVAGFIGSPKMNFLAASVQSSDASGSVLSLAGLDAATIALPVPNLGKGEAVTIGARPEVLAVHTTPASLPDDAIALPATVVSVERLGNINYAYFDIAQGTPVTVQIMGYCSLVVGQAVTLSLPRDKCHFFDSAGISMTGGNCN
jgi:multiple sugar transport system ATP-binding protein